MMAGIGQREGDDRNNCFLYRKARMSLPRAFFPSRIKDVIAFGVSAGFDSVRDELLCASS